MFQGAFDSDEGWSFGRRPITDAGNEAVKTAEVYLEGELVRMTSRRVPVFTDLLTLII